MTRVCGTALALVLVASPAFAQATTSYGPSSSSSGVGIRAYAVVDVDSISATKSFEAVLGTSQLTALGAGVDATGVFGNLFFRVAVTRATKDGTRVFVDGGQVFPLNIPLTVRLTPIEVGGGWRFESKRKPSRFVPYIGASFVSLGYEETSSFAGEGDNVSERYAGGAGFGGVDVLVYKWLTVGGEAQFRSIQAPEASRGTSKEFNERDFGGFTGRVTIGVHFK